MDIALNCVKKKENRVTWQTLLEVLFNHIWKNGGLKGFLKFNMQDFQMGLVIVNANSWACYYSNNIVK